jgi:hypothetical protein
MPLPAARGSSELVITLKIQERRYEFLVDTGADVCLVQQYAGNEPTDETRHAVRAITGQELVIRVSRKFGFCTGNRQTDHDFVVVSFLIKDGITGSDWVPESIWQPKK